MKVIKRILCISIAILLLCTSLTACAPQQEIDIIKKEWRRYVVDRNRKVYYAVVSDPPPSSHASLAIEEQTVINEILDICQTLNVAEITILEGHPDSMFQYKLAVSIGTKELPDTGGISIFLFGSDEAYLHFVTDDMDHWAYVSGWLVYEQLEGYRFYSPIKEDK